jgi:hypothetical protein
VSITHDHATTSVLVHFLLPAGYSSASVSKTAHYDEVVRKHARFLA